MAPASRPRTTSISPVRAVRMIVRMPGCCREAPAEVEPVAVGEAEVEEQEIGPARQGVGLGDGAGQGHAVALGFQRPEQAWPIDGSSSTSQITVTDALPRWW
jgi:hypothetical protein